MFHLARGKGFRTRINPPTLIVATSIVLAVAIAGLGAVALMQMRRDAIEHASQASSNLALTLERSITRNLQIYELSIHGVTDAVQDPQIMALTPSVRQRLLFDWSMNAEDMGSLLVTDAHGDLVLDSRIWPPRPVNVADRDYFQAHLKSPTAGVFVSQPFQPRMTADNKSIGISRRLSAPDGSFAGIVVGTLRLNYFRKLFDGMILGPRGSLTLVHTDGTIVMRRPYEDASIGRNISSSPSFAPLLKGENDTFLGTAALDGMERLYSFRRVPGFPLIVVVGLSVDDVLAPWRARAWLSAALIAAMDVLVIALSVLLSLQWRRRMDIERHLRLMVDTDGLTGLGSRRALDDAADLEWRRARRHNQPLSLLMVDVDHFKQFNDRYGHLSGDDALASVARCIQQTIRRPGDFAGRYGGEEFAILLPSTEAAGAAAVAETIRAAVQAMHIPNAGSTFGELTVSIGAVTDTTDSSGDRTFADLRAFLRAADEALYQSKRTGRNRVASADATVTAIMAI
ncbi:sensor domain-containing diguanylate cyclase [Cupriavidus sp. RAF12]|uniref:sensor domain-containing diguanylate cyclase n=1 Tax=Cupriavidus sp. RAF12 TaxID=3233050 RepID=UPI003F9153C8